MDNKDISLVTRKSKVALPSGGEIERIITLPRSEKTKGFNKFYDRVEDNCVRFCENGLAMIIKDISHSYRYRLSSEVSEDGDTVRVTVKVTLTDRTAARVIERREMTHVWKYGLLVRAK